MTPFAYFFFLFKKAVNTKITVRMVVKIIYKKKMGKTKEKLKLKALFTTNESSFIILFIFNTPQPIAK